MRSGKLDLDDVVALFEGWRANKQGRLIPAGLWQAAIGLLDRYSPSAICRRLRLSPARFKEVRQAAVAGAADGSRGAGVPVRGGDRQAVRAPRPLPARVAAVRGERAFVEFPALGVAIGEVAGPRGRGEVPPASAGCRLVLESATGTLTVLTRAPDDDLVDAVCRFVLGAVGRGARP
jgi:hypothetical protein